MKKLILLFFVLIWYCGYTQPYITELIISPTGDDNIIKVSLTTGSNHIHFYEGEYYEIVNDIIILKVCTSGSAATAVNYIETVRYITLPNVPDDYTLVCEIYSEIPSLPCEFDPEDMTDSASLSFSAPLEDDVVLNTPYFDHPEKEVTIFPNPTVKEFFIESPFASLQNIILYDLQGKQVKIFEPHDFDTPRFDVSELSGGVYFIAMEIEGRRVVKKLVVRR